MQTRCAQLLVVALIFARQIEAADRSIEPIVSHIPRTSVESSALAAVGFSKHLHALEIEFHDGLIYRYLEVPSATYRGLMRADSKARFYNHRIRGKYRCLRVRPRRDS